MVVNMAKRPPFRDLFLVPPQEPLGSPGKKFQLRKVDPASTPGLPATEAMRKRPKATSRADVAALAPDLCLWQEALYARAKTAGDPRRLLVVLQAMDAGGKDGTVNHVMGLVNPQGLAIRSFGVPTAEEREHDFLWRIRRAVPAAGYIGVFNRSHYEDVLVARVHNLVPEATWRERYTLINEFERELVDQGVTFLKIMLHISPDEQRTRLLERLDDPTKRWKFNPGDLDERALWPAYQEAYQEALTRCSTEAAPWHVIPADHKWYRDWAVAHLLRKTLRDLKLEYPPADFDVAAQKARLSVK
jgi:PPK2 family polyphosphate:nucleotide phosphotransferase